MCFEVVPHSTIPCMPNHISHSLPWVCNLQNFSTIPQPRARFSDICFITAGETLRNFSHCSGKHAFLAGFVPVSDHPCHRYVALSQRWNVVLLSNFSWLLEAHLLVDLLRGAYIVLSGLLGGTLTSSVRKSSFDRTACRHFQSNLVGR